MDTPKDNNHPNWIKNETQAVWIAIACGIAGFFCTVAFTIIALNAPVGLRTSAFIIGVLLGLSLFVSAGILLYINAQSQEDRLVDD